jgi:hypothetical protein
VVTVAVLSLGVVAFLPASGVELEDSGAKAASRKGADETRCRVTLELGDGSRVVGRCLDDRLQFRSESLGDFKLEVKKLRVLESLPRTNLVKLSTARDILLAEPITKELRMETSFGSVKVPFETIRSLRVTLVGASGRPTRGLIGLWSADGDGRDAIGGKDGRLQNVRFVNGVSGQAFSFAPDSYPWGTYCGVQIQDQPAFALTRSLSVECWVRPRGHSAYMIFFRGDHRPGLDPYHLSMDGNQNLEFGVCDEEGKDATVRVPVELGAWIHVAGVLDDASGAMKLYTNGVLAAETETTVRPFGKLQEEEFPGVGIGNVNDGGNNFPFAGDIDEVGLYDRPLSQEEVNAIFAEHAAGAGERAGLLPAR